MDLKFIELSPDFNHEYQLHPTEKSDFHSPASYQFSKGGAQDFRFQPQDREMFLNVPQKSETRFVINKTRKSPLNNNLNQVRKGQVGPLETKLISSTKTKTKSNLKSIFALRIYSTNQQLDKCKPEEKHQDLINKKKPGSFPKLVKVKLQKVPQPGLEESGCYQAGPSPGLNSIIGGVSPSFKAYFRFDSNNESEEPKYKFNGTINLIEEANRYEEVSIDTVIDVEKALAECPRFMEYYNTKILEMNKQANGQWIESVFVKKNHAYHQ